MLSVAMKKRLLNNPTLNQFAKHVSASIISMIGLSCYILADTIFISMDMGKIGLAALNIATPTFNLIFALGILFAVGGSIRFAIHKGAGELHDGNIIFTHTFLVVGIIATLFVILGGAASGPIATMLGADGETYEYSKIYIQIILCFAPFFMFNTVFQNFVRNDGAPRLAMIATISGNLFNILFDYVLIFPCRLGMLGAALATGFSPVISLAIMGVFFFARKKNTFTLIKTKLSARITGQIVSLGVPSFMSELSTGVVMLITNKLFYNLYGNNDGVAAYGIIVNLTCVVSAILNGVSQGSQPLISFNKGAGSYHRIRKVLKYALITISSLAIIMYITIAAGAEVFTSLFNTQNDPHVQMIAPYGMRLYFLYAVIGCFNIMMTGYFSAMGKALYSQLITVFRCYIIVIPLLFILTSIGGATGLWLALAVTEALCLIISICLFAKSNKVKLYKQQPYILERSAIG